MSELSSFPVVRYQLQFRVEQQLELPRFSGKIFRSVFGMILRRQVCSQPDTECQNCPMLASCAYNQLFHCQHQPQTGKQSLQKFSQIPAPLLIEAPHKNSYQAGEVLKLNVVLIGKALDFLPLIIDCWRQSGAAGIGKQRVPLVLTQLYQVTDDQTSLKLIGHLDQGDWKMQSHFQQILPKPYQAEQGKLVLEFVSPLKMIKKKRDIKPSQLTARDLLVGLIKRTALISQYHCQKSLDLEFSKLAEQAQKIQIEQDLHWHQWQRHSSRQQQNMPMGGLVGKIHLSGDLQPFWPFLQLGQWLHTGKHTTFGLGHYRIIN